MTLASIVEQPPLEIERVAELLLIAVVLTALAAALLALVRSGLTAGTRWIRHRGSSLAPGESMFVGRWGRGGPELFVVGASARRLLPAEPGRPGLARRAAGEVGAVLAAGMLRETLGRRPSRELTWAFAEERLGHLPADGLVIPTAEVVAWLDARHDARSGVGGWAVGGGAALILSWLRPGARSRTEERVAGRAQGRPGPRGENRAGPLRS